MSLINLLKVFGNDVIEFYCRPEYVGVIPEPKPAIKNLPPWFKDLNPYCEYPVTAPDGTTHMSRDPFGEKVMTAKKCLPLIDAMSLGYTIPLAGDIHVKSNHDNTQLMVNNPPAFKVCDHHNFNQLGGQHKLGIEHGDALKFINFWVIKTAPGWSTLFVPPLNDFHSPFVCFSGLVDTDEYPKEVNFPAILRIKDADVSISAGTPLVTAIPIKRNTFPKKPKIRKIKKRENDELNRIQTVQSLRSHYYTYELRKRDSNK